MVATQKNAKIESFPLETSHPPHLSHRSVVGPNLPEFTKGAVSQDLGISSNQKLSRSYASTVLCSASDKRREGSPQRKYTQAVTPKIAQIRRSSFSSNPYCFKCGDKGHQAISCRNRVVCFRCHRLGHRSYNCRATMLRSTNQAVREEVIGKALQFSNMKFLPNKAIRDFDEVLKRGIVIKDDLAFSKGFIPLHLMKEHPVKGFAWVPRLLGDNPYLLNPPNVQWR